MNKRLILILLLVAGCQLLVNADKLSGGGKVLYESINSGGSVMNSTNYKMKDAKGETVGGKSTSTGSIFKPGLFGLVAGGLEEPPPAGTVRLKIEAKPGTSDLKISWPDYSGDPQIYIMTGDGSGQFTADVGWALIYENGALTPAANNFGTLSDTVPAEITHEEQFSQGYKEVYYKGLKSGINPATAHPDFGPATYLAVAWPVGKVNIDLAKDGEMKLVSAPFRGGQPSVYLPQLLGSNQELVLLPRVGSGLDYITVTDSGVTGSDFDMDPTIGFWMRNPNSSDLTITFLGDMVRSATTESLVAFDLTGNPIAVPVSSNVLGVDGDIILPQSGAGLDYYVKSGGSWGPNFPSLNLNAGFWYKYSGGNRRWSIDPHVPAAQIEQY